MFSYSVRGSVPCTDSQENGDGVFIVYLDGLLKGLKEKVIAHVTFSVKQSKSSADGFEDVVKVALHRVKGNLIIRERVSHRVGSLGSFLVRLESALIKPETLQKNTRVGGVVVKEDAEGREQGSSGLEVIKHSVYRLRAGRPTRSDLVEIMEINSKRAKETD